MSELLNWGADLIVWAQQFQQPIVRLPMIALSWLGGLGYLFTLPLVVFALYQRTGLRLAMLFQRPHMLRLSALRNIVLGLWLQGVPWREARERAYAMVDRIDWAQGFCRRDIGWRAIERTA